MLDINIKIGDILFSISSENGMSIDTCLKPFFTVADSRSHADCNMRLISNRPQIKNLKSKISNHKLFEADTTWGLYSGQKAAVSDQRSAVRTENLLTIPSLKNGSRRRLFAEFDNDFRNGTVYFHKEGENYFLYPFLELLTINLLAESNGVLLHASCIDDNGSGYLFLGHSGAGKSTIANIWNEEKGIRILSDDRVIVSLSEEGLIAHGTPWHGTANYAINASVPVRKVFFISHSVINSAIKINGIKATSELVRNAFLTFWDKQRMEYSTETLMQISQKAGMFSLGFYPDKKILDFVRNV
ncbi:MAG: hypothetical protein HZB30_08285 [Nitrospirae bacterium]|nr:hypothetical protein [Nitrospirota bacterium]